MNFMFWPIQVKTPLHFVLILIMPPMLNLPKLYHMVFHARLQQVL